MSTLHPLKLLALMACLLLLPTLPLAAKTI